MPSSAFRRVRCASTVPETYTELPPCGGRNAGDGVPYGVGVFFIIPAQTFLGKRNIRIEISVRMVYNGSRIL